MKVMKLLLVLMLGLFGGSVMAQDSSVLEWGKTESGETIHLYTLVNTNGLQARIMDYGATLVGLHAPDRNGKMDNLTLFLDSPKEYLAGHPLFGSTVGRYANRIDGGGFTIDGTRYDLETVNAKTNVHIHGGRTGFQRLMWSGTEVATKNSAGVKLELVSPDGHEGFPGEVRASVTYRLTNDNELFLEYEATTTKPTHVNLTNHAYWNLTGAGSGPVLHHKLRVNAARYLEVDERKIPSGNRIPVIETPLDFTLPHKLGPRIKEIPGGLDHCFAINHLQKGDLSMAAQVTDRKTGRVMEVWTTAPGVQVYTANGLKDTLSGNGKPYGPYHGICLECQHYPDSPNRSTFPSTLLRPGQTYRQTTMHKFYVAD